jgi:hypothetical protein
MRIFGGGGARNEGGWYALDRTRAYDAPATFAGGKFSTAPFTLDLSFIGAAEPVTLVEASIREGVVVDEDGIALVESGRLAGVLTPEAAERVYVESANLSLRELLLALEVPPDVDHDDSGSAESWTMALRFSTVPVWLF